MRGPPAAGAAGGGASTQPHRHSAWAGGCQREECALFRAGGVQSLAPWGCGERGSGVAGRGGWKAPHIQEGAAGHVENDAAQGPDVRFLAEGELEGFGGHPGLVRGVCWQE